MHENLKSLREEIDNIDQEILQLLEERQKVVHRVGKYKSANKEICFIKPDREDQMLKILCEKQQSLPRKLIVKIWRAIISASLITEKNFTILSCTKNLFKEGLPIVSAYFADQVKIKSFPSFEELSTAFSYHPESIIAVSTEQKDILFELLENSNNKIFASFELHEGKKIFLIAQIKEENLANGQNFYLVTSNTPQETKEKIDSCNASVLTEKGNKILFTSAADTKRNINTKIGTSVDKIAFVGSSGETSSW